MKTHMMLFCLVLTAMLFRISIAAEENHDKSHADSPQKKEAAGDKDERKVVRLTPAARLVANLEIQPCGPRAIANSVDAPGEIALNDDRLARVTPKISGVVSKILHVAGDTVKEGETLAVLDSIELGNAKIDFFTARTALENAKFDLDREQQFHDATEKLLIALKDDANPADIEKTVAELRLGDVKSKVLGAYSSLRAASTALARAQKLKPDNLISGSSFDDAQKAFETAKVEYKGALEEIGLNYKYRLVQAQRTARLADASLKNAERRLVNFGLLASAITQESLDQTSSFELKSLIAGTVLDRQLTIGERAEEGKSAFLIANLSSVWCNLRIYANHLEDVKTGQRVRITVGSHEKSMDAMLVWISPIVDERTRSAIGRAVLENSHGDLRPGLFAAGSVILDETKVPMAVPAEAIQTIDGKSVVFVNEDAEKEGEFHVNPVLTGISDDHFVEIKAGLKAGARVVVRNSFTLKAEAGKGSDEE